MNANKPVTNIKQIKNNEHTTLSGVDEKPHKKAKIRNDLSGLFVLLLVDRSRPGYWVQSSLRFLGFCVQ